MAEANDMVSHSQWLECAIVWNIFVGLCGQGNVCIVCGTSKTCSCGVEYAEPNLGLFQLGSGSIRMGLSFVPIGRQCAQCSVCPR